MTLSLNCKDAGDPVADSTMQGETEENYCKMPKSMEKYSKAHGIRRNMDQEIAKNKDQFRKTNKE